jgi:outer membrane protein assembly factor BamB
VLTLILPSPASAVQKITTHHYDNFRTGWNPYEFTLTPANVPGLRLVTQIPLDEQVDAQPLFASGVAIVGGTHNVIYVATENDTIYALDAATGAVLLQRNFGAPVPQSVLPGFCGNNSIAVGINSTPVMDFAAQTLYVMVYTYENNTPIYRLHALALGTLADKVTPVVVQAKARLDDGSTWNFQAAYSRQRSGLLLSNGNVYAAFASFCDINPDRSRGWLLGWQAASLIPLAANELTNKLIPAQSPNDFFLTSIWMSGDGVAADGSGFLYFVTGNSDFSGTTYDPVNNLAESIVKMSPDLSQVLSHFTPLGPQGVSWLDVTDNDTGSGGFLGIPMQPGGVYLGTAAGKVGQMFLLDRVNLGKLYGTYSIGPCWCGESYFVGADGTGRVVSSGGNQIIVWRLQTSPSVALVKESALQPLPATTVQDGGFFTSISSNGNGNAIIWAVGRPLNANPANVTLYAFDPKAAAGGSSNWLFSAVAGTWPHLGGNANIVPVVANGRVYVASYKRLAIFGLAAPAAPVAAAAIGLPPVPPARVALPPDRHEIFGTIKTIVGGNITLTTRSGKFVRVDAAGAVRRHQSVVLLVDEPVTVFGDYDDAGVLQATSVLHAKPSPLGWPPDR